ncbi:MAG TPA: hypothetical protein VHM01_18000, partial [Alphaproteobacteria bacterium]|nr:hypothetical protein [Alphaproteobacteria bacterium]
MGGWRIAVLCLALAGLLATSAAAQDRPGVRTITLPHNMTREEALANEAYRHDFAVEHIRHNMRQLEYVHKNTLENIQKDDRLEGGAKARRIADENQRFEIQMRGQQRQLAIAEQEH